MTSGTTYPDALLEGLLHVVSLRNQDCIQMVPVPAPSQALEFRPATRPFVLGRAQGTWSPASGLTAMSELYGWQLVS